MASALASSILMQSGQCRPMSSQRPRKRWRVVVAALMLLAATAVGLWRAWPRSMLLIDRAVRLTPASYPIGGDGSYYWAQDGGLLLSNDADQSDNKVRRLSLGTGQLTTVWPIGKAELGILKMDSASPAGRWIAVEEPRFDSDQLTLVEQLVDLTNGKRVRLANTTDDRASYWMFASELLWSPDEDYCGGYDYDHSAVIE